MEKPRTIDEATARTIFTPTQIEAAKNHEIGYLGEAEGAAYYLNIEFKDVRVSMGNVEIVDQHGEGNNFGRRR